jgi:hypothetical protein
MQIVEYLHVTGTAFAHEQHVLDADSATFTHIVQAIKVPIRSKSANVECDQTQTHRSMRSDQHQLNITRENCKELIVDSNNVLRLHAEAWKYPYTECASQSLALYTVMDHELPAENQTNTRVRKALVTCFRYKLESNDEYCKSVMPPVIQPLSQTSRLVHVTSYV